MQLHKSNHYCLNRQEIGEFLGACSCWSCLVTVPVRRRLVSTKVAGVKREAAVAWTVFFNCTVAPVSIFPFHIHMYTRSSVLVGVGILREKPLLWRPSMRRNKENAP